MHPMGFKVPKYVTVVLQMKDDDVDVHCYMVSDQCQAIVNAGVFADSDDRKKLIVREPAHDEMGEDEECRHIKQQHEDLEKAGH